MGYKSKIEWTDSSWNPVIGCTKISQGCKNCYAESIAERFRGVKNHPFENGFDLQLQPHKIEAPLSWKKPRLIFVCSMSDLFHRNVPSSFISDVFRIMNLASWHTFQLLTKRSKRLAKIAPTLNWSMNIWAGVSVESSEQTDRIHDLVSVPSEIRFLSLEPLLGPIPNLSLDGIDWAIVGGESGSRARPMEIDWAREIQAQCKKKSVPFFLKQLGGRRSKRGGDDAKLDGRLWREYPVQIQALAP